jgi:hypothetical protein
MNWTVTSQNLVLNQTKEKKIDSKNDSINEANDHYEEFLHPNMMRDSTTVDNR